MKLRFLLLKPLVLTSNLYSQHKYLSFVLFDVMDCQNSSNVMKNRSKIIKIKHYITLLEIWFQTTKTGLLSQILLVQRKLLHS